MPFPLEAIAIGLLLGGLLGLTGAGGSLVALPLLLSLHLPLTDAIGVSLGAVALASLVGTLGRWAKRQVHWRTVFTLAITGVPGSWLGQYLGRYINETWLIIAFCLLVLWSAWRMWHQAELTQHSQQQQRPWLLILIGLLVGVLSGLLGVGGGFLIVPALLWFSPLGMLAATATSMAVITLITSAGFIIYLQSASPPLPLLIGLFGGGSLGVLLGNQFAYRLGGPALQRVFALVLLLVSLSVAVQKLLPLL